MPRFLALIELLRPLPALVVLGAVLRHVATPNGACCEDVDSAFVQDLADNWLLSASPSDVHWVDQPDADGWPRQRLRAWVLAEPLGRGADVYLVHAERAKEGGLLGVRDVFNVTDTFAAAEGPLAASGALAAWGVGDAEQVYRIQLADAGTPRLANDSELSDWERLRWRVTWLQNYGQQDGLTRRLFRLDPPARELTLEAHDGEVRWSSGKTSVVVPRNRPPSRGGRYVREEPQSLPAPGNWVTWAVDRVRSISWFGSDRMQLIKAIVYRGRDWAEQRLGLELDADTSPTDYETQTGSAGSAPPDASPTRPANARIPPPIPPLLTPALENEGQWVSLAGDPFIRPTPESGGNFWTTFIRPDQERKFSRVLIVLWDPSIIDLHMMSGTEEPKSATGETGTGVVPNEHLPRLVAAFNGGFQGTHGDYGMAVDKTLYVPPKPYAATVARLEGGRTAFGTWPPEQATAPDWMPSFRQNLTPLVARGQANPYGRLWWGGVPEGWEDDTQTVRSGLCRTKDGFVAYFYGTKTDADKLASAMLAARCEFGMHLDMNQGHTGLEFYTVDEAEKLPPLALTLSPTWQAEGPLDRVEGYRFRGRRLFRGMQLMNFPRYIRPETRDFFYLTVREHLPGRPITRPAHLEPGEAHWQTNDLPQRGEPPAIARASLRADAAFPESRLHLVKLDPRRFRPDVESPATGPIASWSVPPTTGDMTVAWGDGQLTMAAPTPDQTGVLLRGSAAASDAALAAAGLTDDGLLLYAEIATGGPPAHSGGDFLRKGLELAGATRLLFLSEPVSMIISGKDLSQHPTTAAGRRVHLGRWEDPGFEDIFTETPVVPRAVWRPLQKSTVNAAH